MYLDDDSLGHVTTEMLLHIVILFQRLLQTALRSVLQNEAQRTQDHAVQSNDVSVLQWREDSQLLLQVVEPRQDGVARWQSGGCGLTRGRGGGRRLPLFCESL